MADAFTVLHVCLGNICRSPMAERLFALRAREAAEGVDLVRSVSVGTGDWHVGEWMNPPAAQQIEMRGGDTSNYAAATLKPEDIAQADLILAAATEHMERLLDLAPEASARIFMLREFADLLAKVDNAGLPKIPDDVAKPVLLNAVRERGIAVVRTADELRAERLPDARYNVDDPWGMGDRVFARVAHEIDDAVTIIAQTTVKN
ncbi:MAG: phosphotyrosine protein phosphatase [Corynebacteriales bacterium]|nr:phosphotyrosine protein phosphatase [Mycobacteriales bacterium]